MKEPDAQRSAQRAKRTVRERVVMMRSDTMMTLTFQDNLTDLDEAWSCWRKYQRKLSRYLPWMKSYVCVHELQKRGAIHFHVALKTDGVWLPYSSLIKQWRQVIGGLGSVKISRDHSCRNRQRAGKIYSYLAKYMGKNFTAGELNKKRYEVARGMTLPTVLTLYFPVGDDTPLLLSKIIKAMSGRLPETKYTAPGVIHLRSY
jgi:hypothetical protein